MADNSSGTDNAAEIATSAMGMEELMSAAAGKGMLLVNSNEEGTDALFDEYATAIKEAEALCAVEDPETAPYESKYKARNLLDEIAKKLEANRTIAMLEKQKLKIAAIDRRLAAVRVRLGVISFDCEEPHNAQTDLELSCDYYFPKLVQLLDQRVQQKDPGTSTAAVVDEEEAEQQQQQQQQPLQLREGDLELPAGVLTVLREDMVVDAMKQLNLLGILWSNRGQLHKALLYLTAARRFYETNSIDATAADGKRALSLRTQQQLGDAFTHCCFYLAQAFGHLGDVQQASRYCHETLQRQLAVGLQKDIAAALEWVKNCSSIADFYSAMRQLDNCALALASAEKVLKDCAIAQIIAKNAAASEAAAVATAIVAEAAAAAVVPPAAVAAAVADDSTTGSSILPPPPTTSVATSGATEKVSSCSSSSSAAQQLLPSELRREVNNFISGNLNAAEIEAELSRRWAALHISVLHAAYERAKRKETLLSLGTVSDVQCDELLDEEDALQQQQQQQQQSSAAATTSSINTTITTSPTATATASAGLVEFFRGLPVAPTPLLEARNIRTFEDARTVFLRAAARIDFAKKYYVLDGHVTDHVTLSQEHSKLYHYLACFETDSKRKLAMENRRLEMLAPLLAALSKTSFEVLHKQLSYELGETALCMVDIKLDKFRERNTSGSGEVDVRRLKKAEISKSNEYCKTALAMFAHFTHMYAPLTSQNSTVSAAASSQFNFSAMVQRELHELPDMACTAPDEALISEEEVRPFLNAHFLSCRVMTKIIATAATTTAAATIPAAGSPALFLIAALKRYKWLCTFAERICQRRGLKVDDVFSDEIRICREMVQLLPSKIDRMCYRGEGGLSL